MEKKRSKGVTVWGILLIIFPFFALLAGATYSWLTADKPLILLPAFVLHLFIKYPHYLIIWIVSIVCGIGVLKLKEWTRKLIIYWTSFCISIAIVALIFGMGKLLFQAKYLLALIYHCLLFWFFIHPKIKQQFK